VNTDQGEGARYRGRRTWLAQWASDLRLGVRLAIGGGRTSKTGVARLVLGTIGIGIAVVVLLVGASAGPMFNARNDRQNAQEDRTAPVAGVDPLYRRGDTVEFREKYIEGNYVFPSGPHPPLPPGVSRLPGDGEMLVSPALAELLGSADGKLLRPRFPQRIIGTIGRDGVTDATTLSFYAGDKSLRGENRDSGVYAVYGFGRSLNRQLPPNLVLLIVIGSVVLLVPVFVFVATSARIAGAERDRRLAALRLVGADSRQARRIAAAESLASAGTGLLFGIGLFLVFRSLIGNFPVLGVSAYPSDLTPPWSLALLIVLAVPLLAVVTAQVALRRTIIEPLGVVRRGRPSRRRLWWRLVPMVLGPLLLFSQGNITHRPGGWEPQVVLGAAMLLLGIPAMLPWLLERAVARLRGGRPAMQLAIRRLQLDSGTPARVVGGVAVVLAGAIALDAVLASQAARYDLPAYQRLNRGDLLPSIMVTATDGDSDAIAGSVRAVPGVRSAIVAREVGIMHDGDRGPSNSMTVVDCEPLLHYAAVDHCTDGDVFRPDDRHDELAAGQTVTLVGYGPYAERQSTQRWTLPSQIGQIRYTGNYFSYGSLLVTPGALRGLPLPAGTSTQIGVFADRTQPDVLEQVRNAIVPYGWRVRASAMYGTGRSQTLDLLLTVRNGLLGGALFTLLLAGISMLVLALEQMRERRRPLAALAATGVPTGTLARSLLWQNTVPVLLAVAVAVVTGIGLAEMVFRLIDEPFAMDWGNVALYSGVAIVLVLLVTAMTLPTLRSATRLACLRTE
jgi:FtsX-like permease family protein